jgi:hypothetical protein
MADVSPPLKAHNFAILVIVTSSVGLIAGAEVTFIDLAMSIITNKIILAMH